MKTQTYSLEVITPCFCAGAEPAKQAEIRAPSIRGQLRWWFRTMGGFKSLASQSVRDQEAMIFGSTAGENGQASKLVIRIAQPVISTARKDADAMRAPMNSEKGYLLFPLRSQRDRVTQQITEDKSRGVFDTPVTIELICQWRGDAALAPDLAALIAVFGHLGSLGFRSRRAMGALRFTKAEPDLAAALARFHDRSRLVIRQMRATSAEDCIVQLARWLKGWRAHGRSIDHAHAKAPEPPHNIGFNFAQTDHDRGLDILQRRGTIRDLTNRPALGLPIIQRFSNNRGTVNWEAGPRGEQGRFASPVLLRPHRDAQGGWRALVIFVDAHQWPKGKSVYLNGLPRPVSLDLYESMKQDPSLLPFP